MGGTHPGKPSTSHTCWDGVGTREEERGEVGERRGGEENDRLRDLLSGVTLSEKFFWSLITFFQRMDPSIQDTNGTVESVHISEVSLFQGFSLARGSTVRCSPGRFCKGVLREWFHCFRAHSCYRFKS